MTQEHLARAALEHFLGDKDVASEALRDFRHLITCVALRSGCGGPHPYPNPRAEHRGFNSVINLFFTPALIYDPTTTKYPHTAPVHGQLSAMRVMLDDADKDALAHVQRWLLGELHATFFEVHVFFRQSADLEFSLNGSKL